MQTEINIDFETYSEVDLKEAGLHLYSIHPSTEILMAAWSVNSGKVQQWVPAEGEPLPDHLKSLLTDKSVLKRAHNASFEIAMIQHVMGLDVDPDEWRCTQALGLSLSLPASLKNLGEAVGLAEDKKKDSRGKALIRKFCGPRTPTITRRHTRANIFTDYDDWELFKEYNKQDVVAELAILSKIKKWDLCDTERQYWSLDWKINNRGIPINEKAVANAVDLLEQHFDIRFRQMQQATGLENSMSPAQLLPWLNSRGYVYDDVKAGHIRTEVKRLREEGVEDVAFLEAMECRLELAKSSVKKYYAIKKGISPDSRLRGCFQYCGASRTGRFGGRRFQPQNLVKVSSEWEKRQHEMAEDLENLTLEEAVEKYGNPMELISGALRTVVQAPKGKLIVDADLSAIENRVIGWLCGDEKILSVFTQGRDPYIDFAQYLFGQTYEELWAEYKGGAKKKRTIAKPAVLGAGYGLGVGVEREDLKTGELVATGLLGYARGMGIDMTVEEAQHSIDVFRSVYSGVTDYWRVIERAAMRCVRTGAPQSAGPLEFRMEKPFLRMYLPSGRALSYLSPRVMERMTPWGEKKAGLTYLNTADSGKMLRTDTYYGKLVENAVQAIARDLLLHGMKLADDRGLDIFMHVHDQITVIADEAEAEEQLKILIECMETPPDWARDLPLGAEGHTTWCFIKD